jgi:hypothetical protein
MSFKTEVDAEAEKLIKQGVSPMDALKQAIQNVSERMNAEMEQSEGENGILQKPKKDSP